MESVAKKITKKTSKYNKQLITQTIEGSDFQKNYDDWEKHCDSIKNDTLKVKEGTLLDFLVQHVDEARDGSQRDGGRLPIKEIRTILNTDILEESDIKSLKAMEKHIAGMKGSKGKGGLDPAFISFTDKKYDKRGILRSKKEVYGHYMTQNYIDRKKQKDKKFDGEAVDGDWLAGRNPPHLALFSEKEGDYSKPYGLLKIIKEALESFRNIDVQPTINSISRKNAEQLDTIYPVEKFFDNVVKTSGYWAASGKLKTSAVAAEFKATQFEVKRAGRVILRELTNLNNLAGRITAFKIAASIPINTLVDKALKRANSKNAPTDNKYRAWASSAFDYRKTRKEVYGKDTKSPNNKVISKSWKEIMRA